MFRLAVLLALVALAALTDLRDRKIPNALTVSGVVLGLALGTWEGHLAAALLGVATALLIGLPFFAAGALGGGDAKLLAAVGALMGPVSLVSVLLYGAVAGGVIALLGAVRRGTILPVLLRARSLALYWATLGRRGERWSLDSPGAVAIPFGVAIAFGSVAAWFFPLIQQGGTP